MYFYFSINNNILWLFGRYLMEIHIYHFQWVVNRWWYLFFLFPLQDSIREKAFLGLRKWSLEQSITVNTISHKVDGKMRILSYFLNFLMSACSLRRFSGEMWLNIGSSDRKLILTFLQWSSLSGLVLCPPSWYGRCLAKLGSSIRLQSRQAPGKSTRNRGSIAPVYYLSRR